LKSDSYIKRGTNREAEHSGYRKIYENQDIGT
jgi:hypothetical protein